MHGLGDNLHERAIVRELMREHEVWLKTSWPQIFWDMPQLHLVPLKSPLAWMAKNEIRTAALYGRDRPPIGFEDGEQRLSQPDAPRQSRLGAADHGRRVRRAAWRWRFSPADSASSGAPRPRPRRALNPTKPLMIYRPLIALSELNRESARAKLARNPDFAAYHALVSRIRRPVFRGQPRRL